MSSPGQQQGKPLILIDAECALCNAFAKFVIRQDPAGQFQFAGLSSSAAGEALSQSRLPPPPAGTFVLVEDGKAYFRSEAALRVMELLGRPWSFLAAFRVIPRPLRDAVYSLVARLRHRIPVRTDSCSLMSRDERSRFLS